MSKFEDKLLEHFLLQEMAYNRDDYKSHIVAKLMPAIVDHYQVVLAKKLGETEWVQHWKTSTRRFLRGFEYEAMYDIKNFNDRWKAYEEVVVYIKSKDKNWQRDAETHVKDCYKLKKLDVCIDDADTDEFWERVDVLAKISIFGDEEEI